MGAGPWGRALAGLAALDLWTAFRALGRRLVVALVSVLVMEGLVMASLVGNGVGMDGLDIDRGGTGTKGQEGGLLLIWVHGRRPQPRWSVRDSAKHRSALSQWPGS